MKTFINKLLLVVILVSFIFTLEIMLFTFNFSQTQSSTNLSGFDFPLNDDVYDYGPIMWQYGATPQIVEDTRYGIHNPDLSETSTCFSWTVALSETYHAGEDWYRFDKTTGEMLETADAEVKAVADGIVVHLNPITRTYPGNAIVIEHTLSPPREGHDKIYSVYMHLEEVYPAENDTVLKGEVIGTVLAQDWQGNNPDPTRPSYDSHLHWEMRYFFDGSNIYDPSTTCNKTDLIAGRGYTYPEHPNYFPIDTPYTNPSDFVDGYEVYAAQVYKAPPPPTATATPNPTATFTPMPTPTPTLTPTPTPTPDCIEGQDLIVNGDLEAVDLHYLWVADGSQLIDDQNPYEGIYGLWLGGLNNAEEEIYQVITMPTTITSATTTFMFYVSTTETAPQDNDLFYMDLKRDDTGESVLNAPVVYSNQFEPKDTWVSRSVVINGLYRQAGQVLRLSFSDNTNASIISNFFVDNSSFKTHCE